MWIFLLTLFLLALCFYIGFQVASWTDRAADLEFLTAEGYMEQQQALQEASVPLNNKLVILLAGSDRRAHDTGRSDTIMLVFLDTEKKSVNIISVPRDTYVTITKSNERTKINHAYAYGGVPLLEDTLEGFADIKIDRYVDINFEGFIKLVDAWGGRI